MSKKFLCYILLLSISGLVYGAKPEKIPACYGVDNWATQVTTSKMVNDGLLKESDDIFDNGRAIETALLESRKVGMISTPPYPKEALYRQIQKISLKNKDGKLFEIITISNVSDAECSMNGPTMILITPELKILDAGVPYEGEISPD